MACDYEQLLSDGKCFAALPEAVLKAIQVQLWCNIGGGVVPPVNTNPPLLSNDGQWYVVDAIDLGGGNGTISVDQTAVPPSTHPYLVLLNSSDGLLYKFGLVGSPPDVFWFIDETPIVETETPTVLTNGSEQWTLSIVNDGGLTAQLTPV